MSVHDERQPADELVRHYREASEQDSRGPGAHVRDAVHVHARAVLAARQNSEVVASDQPDAANQSRWKINMLASVLLAGLTGLLVLQFDRGSSEEKDVAFGQPRAAAVATPPPAAPAVEPQPSSGPDGSDARVAPTPSPGRKDGRTVTEPTLPALESRKAQTAKSASDKASHSAASAPSAPSVSSVLPAGASAESTGAADQVAEARAPESNVATAPVPARPAIALQKMESRQPSSRAPTASSPAGAPGVTGLSGRSASALFEAARAGRSAEVEGLVQRGAPVNAVNDAGKTPLMLAVMAGHIDSVQRLLALGANPALTDQDGLTALQQAERLGLDQIASLIRASTNAGR